MCFSTIIHVKKRWKMTSCKGSFESCFQPDRFPHGTFALTLARFHCPFFPSSLRRHGEIFRGEPHRMAWITNHSHWSGSPWTRTVYISLREWSETLKADIGWVFVVGFERGRVFRRPEMPISLDPRSEGYPFRPIVSWHIVALFQWGSIKQSWTIHRGIWWTFADVEKQPDASNDWRQRWEATTHNAYIDFNRAKYSAFLVSFNMTNDVRCDVNWKNCPGKVRCTFVQDPIIKIQNAAYHGTKNNQLFV